MARLASKLFKFLRSPKKIIKLVTIISVGASAVELIKNQEEEPSASK